MCPRFQIFKSQRGLGCQVLRVFSFSLCFLSPTSTLFFFFKQYVTEEETVGEPSEDTEGPSSLGLSTNTAAERPGIQQRVRLCATKLPAELCATDI